MAIVRCIFLNDQQAEAALHQLRTHFANDQIVMRYVRPRASDPKRILGDYDPLGGFRMAGTTMTTLPAAGGTLVGNSTTMDLSLGELDEILAMAAESERSSSRNRSTRILATVTVPLDAEAELARRIMTDSGGQELPFQGTPTE